MKLIFLDIDDVLNDKNTPLMPHPRIPERQMLGIDPRKVALLNRIMDQAGGPQEVEFIASTGWRAFYSDEQLQGLLDDKGFQGRIVGRTPLKMSFIPRQGEISMWFNLDCDRDERDIPLPSAFLILDDEPMKGPWKRHAVKTTTDRGLNTAHVAMGVNILNTRPAAETYAILDAQRRREERSMDRMIERIGQRAKARADAELAKPLDASGVMAEAVRFAKGSKDRW